MADTNQTEFVKHLTSIQSQVSRDIINILSDVNVNIRFLAYLPRVCLFLIRVFFLWLVLFVHVCDLAHMYPIVCFQSKYRKDKADLAMSLFSSLPETLDTRFVKDMTDMFSQVRRRSVFQCAGGLLVVDVVSLRRQTKYKDASKKEMVKSLYSLLPHTKDTQHAKQQSQLHSQVRAKLTS